MLLKWLDLFMENNFLINKLNLKKDKLELK